MAEKKVVNRFAELLALKERRENRKYTRRDIRDETGVSLNSIQNWIHNQTTQYSATQIDVFAKFFGCEPGELFTWEEVREAPEFKTPLAVPF